MVACFEDSISITFYPDAFLFYIQKDHFSITFLYLQRKFQIIYMYMYKLNCLLEKMQNYCHL